MLTYHLQCLYSRALDHLNSLYQQLVVPRFEAWDSVNGFRGHCKRNRIRCVTLAALAQKDFLIWFL